MLAKFTIHPRYNRSRCDWGSMKRENFKSRLGFLLVSAGCAIGIGNVWRFPYITGQNGGGIFVAFYLLFLIIMGVPILTMELAIGRASRASMVPAYKKLEKKGTHWDIHGWVCLIGTIILMMYYTCVCGWMVSYFVKFLTGTFTNSMSKQAISGVFNAMLASPREMLFYTTLTIIIGFLVCSAGLQNGLERVSKYMMSTLLGLITILAIHSLTLKGGMKGTAFFLLPSVSRLHQHGLNTVISAAMNQAFFTLSIGQGSMEIFGSYMSDEKTLIHEAGWICFLDTFVAILSGLIIFPACASYGIEADAGPSLIFITLPNVFVNMTGGRIWGTLFFLFMTFASFSTVIAVFENILAVFMDNFGWSRKKAVSICLPLILILSIPCVLGFNVWKQITFLNGKNILDTEDFLVSNLILPIGSLIMVLFCSYKFGWGFDPYVTEANKGEGMKVNRKLKWYFQIVLPILVAFILINGFIG